VKRDENLTPREECAAMVSEGKGGIDKAFMAYILVLYHKNETFYDL